MTYVLMDDGRWAKNPVIEGLDYFLCFPAELVVANSSLETPKQILKALGIPAVLKLHSESTRCYGKKVKRSRAYWLTLFVPLPYKKITRCDSFKPYKSRTGGVYLDFHSSGQIMRVTRLASDPFMNVEFENGLKKLKKIKIENTNMPVEAGDYIRNDGTWCTPRLGMSSKLKVIR